MNRKIIMGVAIALFSMASISKAQIGVDLENVAKEMTAAKTQWSKDVELDSIFPKYEGVFYDNIDPTYTIRESDCFRGYEYCREKYHFTCVNMLGDTLILPRNTNVKIETRNEIETTTIVYLNGKKQDTLLSGKYVVTGYVIFKENMDSLREIHPELPEFFVGTVDDCKRQILHGEEMDNFFGNYIPVDRKSLDMRDVIPISLFPPHGVVVQIIGMALDSHSIH